MGCDTPGEMSHISFTSSVVCMYAYSLFLFPSTNRNIFFFFFFTFICFCGHEVFICHKPKKTCVYYRICFSLDIFFLPCLIPETPIAVYKMMSVVKWVVNMGIQIVSFEAVLVCFHVCDCMCISDHRSKLHLRDWLPGSHRSAWIWKHGSVSECAQLNRTAVQTLLNKFGQYFQKEANNSVK